MENSLKGTRTEQNLLKAFAGESQAKNRYEFFAKQAKKEGFEQISAIFEIKAEKERSHAKNFFKFLISKSLLFSIYSIFLLTCFLKYQLPYSRLRNGLFPLLS